VGGPRQFPVGARQGSKERGLGLVSRSRPRRRGGLAACPGLGMSVNHKVLDLWRTSLISAAVRLCIVCLGAWYPGCTPSQSRGLVPVGEVLASPSCRERAVPGRQNGG
jgi:hypothetical protein